MTKFKVHFEQWVQETAEIQVEAETAEKALSFAYEQERSGALELDWSESDGVKDVEPTHVTDEAGVEVLERTIVIGIIDEELS